MLLRLTCGYGVLKTYARRLASPEFLRYIATGGFTNASGFLVFAALLSIFPTVRPVFLNVLASLTVFPLVYALNRRWVFRSDAPVGPQLRKFLVVYGTAIVFMATVFSFLLAVSPFPVLIVQLFTMLLLVSVSFLVQAFWTFAHPS